MLLFAAIFSTDNIVLLGAIAGALTAIGVGLVKTFKALWKGFKLAVSEAVDSSDHAAYTKHHLGPNGATPPLWKRIIAVEDASIRLMAIVQTQSSTIRDNQTSHEASMKRVIAGQADGQRHQDSNRAMVIAGQEFNQKKIIDHGDDRWSTANLLAAQKVNQKQVMENQKVNQQEVIDNQEANQKEVIDNQEANQREVIGHGDDRWTMWSEPPDVV